MYIEILRMLQNIFSTYLFTFLATVCAKFFTHVVKYSKINLFNAISKLDSLLQANDLMIL